MKRTTVVQTHHIHYDPVSGYLHKFRLNGSQDAEPPDTATVAHRFDNLPLIVATSIAIGLLMLIGTLAL